MGPNVMALARFGLLLGGILEIYFISIFPVGGAEFPEGGPPTLVAVAVGSAIGSNPVAWLIPCHRVIRSAGDAPIVGL